jgi:hypothetical protein
MKTPRDLILERVRSAESRLAEIRGADLAALSVAGASGKTDAPGVLSGLLFKLQFAIRQLWRESVWPWRRVWMGMAGLWFLILAVNVGTREIQLAGGHSYARPGTEFRAALQEQNRLMAQLLDPVIFSAVMIPALAPAERPKVPGPRSEWRLPAITFPTA